LIAFIFGQLYRSFYSPPHLPFFFVVVFTGFILLLVFYFFFFFSLDKYFDTFNWYLLVSVDRFDSIPKKKQILNDIFELFLFFFLTRKPTLLNSNWI